MKLKKSIFSLILLLTILSAFFAIPAQGAQVSVIKAEYTISGEVYDINCDNPIVHHAADSISLYLSEAVSGEAGLYYYAYEKAVSMPFEYSLAGSVLTIALNTQLEDDVNHKIVYKTENGNIQFDFYVTKSKNNLLLFEEDFEASNKMNLHNFVSDAVTRQETDRGAELHFAHTDEQRGCSYADAVSSAAEYEDNIVIDVVITIEKIEGSALISLFDAKNSSGAWKQGASIYSDGTLKMGNASGKEESVCTVPFNTPFRYSAIYDVAAGEVDIYIDKVFKKTVTSKTVYGKTYRIDLYNVNGGDIEFFVDNLKIYKGSEIIEHEDFATKKRFSVMDYSEKAITSIGDGWVFTDAKFYYKDGKKHKYSSDVQVPVLFEEKMYVSESFVKEILGIDGTGFEKTNVNGNLLISAEGLSDAVGREYLFDKRGFFILSVGEFPYKDSHNFTTLFEESDYIYRYVNFDNPKSEEILHDLKENIGYKTHPRLCYTAEDIEYIKQKAKTDTHWASVVNVAIASADNYLAKEITLTSDCADESKQGQAVSFQSIIEALAQAYLLTGDTAYADKGLEYMDIMCGWESMGYTTSNLTTGHWAMGLAVGYDSFYNYLMETPEGVEKAAYYRKRAAELPFRDTIDAYLARKGREMRGDSYVNAHWITIRDNFQGVINGGVTALALAMADEEDLYDDMMHLLENLNRSMQIAISLYAPDGGYFEAVGYSEYMLGNLTKGITAMFNCCGTDYGMGNGRGFADAGEFFVHMQTPKYRLNFSDCAREASNSLIPAFFAYRYGKVYYAKMTVNENNRFRRVNYDMPGNLNYSKAIDKWGDVDISTPPTDKYYYAAESGVFRNAFDVENPTFVGFHAGTTNRAHDMLDSGEFVFEAGGVPWAIDLGKDDYNLPAYFGDEGYKIYRKHTQGENCVLINPLTDPDNYYGQAPGKEATVEKFVSKPKGAFATVDLSEVYERDVTSYKRGYYFGDGRNTLTVQDEISLSASSELYWFMHTLSDIEIIDNNTVRLTSDGKELMLYVYANQPYTLKSMEAKPLEGTPVIEGQDENEGVSKVAIHFEEAEGEVDISVKLVYQNKFFTADEHTFIPMDSWVMEDGICEVEAVLDEVYQDPYKKLSAVCQLPYYPDEIYLQIDDESVAKLDVERGVPIKISDIDISGIPVGSHKARLLLISGENKEYTENREFITHNYVKNSFYYNDNAINGNHSEVPTGWLYHFTGAVTKYDEYVTVKEGTSSYNSLEFRTSNKNYAIVDDVIVMECDILFSSNDIKFNIECLSKENYWFFHENTLFYKGAVKNGDSYNTNQWYRIRLEINTVLNQCSFYVDGKKVIADQYDERATSNYVYKLQFSSANKEDFVAYKNFEVYTYVAEKETISLNKEGDYVRVQADVADVSVLSGSNLMLLVCEYSKTGLLDMHTFDVVAENNAFYLSELLTPSEETYEYKAFFVNLYNPLSPVYKAIYLKN